MSLKELLWKLSLRKNCPICGAEVWETGHAPEFIQYYKCSNESCSFGR